jgi:hypothetical protein
MDWAKSWAWAALPLALIAVVLFAGASMGPDYRAWAFLAVMALMAGELILIGFLLNGRPAGAFIDNRNRLSLSKLQAGAWTVLVLSAFATAAAYNAAVPSDPMTVTALAVIIPGELLLTMGISATSLVATPALLSLKADEDAHPSDLATVADRTGTNVIANGKVVTNSAPEEASWADLVTGDEVGNAGTPDLGKIQQLLISLILLAAYADYVFQAFGAPVALIRQLPALDKSFVWLMGISHASYLAYKAAPHTKSADGPPARIIAAPPATAPVVPPAPAPIVPPAI